LPGSQGSPSAPDHSLHSVTLPLFMPPGGRSMPIITCPQCRTTNRMPVQKEGLQGNYGRCDQRLPTFSLRQFFPLEDYDFPPFLDTYRDLLALIGINAPPCAPDQTIAPVLARLLDKFGPRACGRPA
jgi:hypothetical protein